MPAWRQACMTALVPTQLVTTKSSGPAIERSTWLSAAKCSTASWPAHRAGEGVEVADIGVHEAEPAPARPPPRRASVDRLPA